MDDQKKIEAQVTTPTGATILIKGDKDDVAQVLALFTGSTGSQSGVGGGKTQTGSASPKALHLVAEKDDDGNINIVATDLKAKSAMDAATRLIYVALLARRELLQEKKVERALVNDVLRSYNLYDGNTRNIIPSDKALVTDGRKYVSLSAAALPKAWQYVKEIQDPSVSGKWTPSLKRRRPKVKQKKSEN